MKLVQAASTRAATSKHMQNSKGASGLRHPKCTWEPVDDEQLGPTCGTAPWGERCALEVQNGVTHRPILPHDLQYDPLR